MKEGLQEGGSRGGVRRRGRSENVLRRGKARETWNSIGHYPILEAATLRG